MLESKDILTPLIPNCYVLCTPAILKTFVIRSFFFKKWLLTHVFELGTLVSNQLQIIEMIKIKYKICNQNKGWGMICQGKGEKKIKKECV